MKGTKISVCRYCGCDHGHRDNCKMPNITKALIEVREDGYKEGKFELREDILNLIEEIKNKLMSEEDEIDTLIKKNAGNNYNSCVHSELMNKYKRCSTMIEGLNELKEQIRELK